MAPGWFVVAKPFRRGTYLATISLLAPKPPARVNHSLGVNGVRAVLALDLQADHTAALVSQDLFGMRVGTHVDLEVLSSRVERADNFRADERTAGRTMRTGLRGTSHQTNVAEIAAVSKQPVDGRGRFRDEGANERRVIEPMTALHRVIEHDFDGVFRALGLLQSSATSIQTAAARTVLPPTMAIFSTTTTLAPSS